MTEGSIQAFTRPAVGWRRHRSRFARATWLWRCLHRLDGGKLPDRVDGPIVLALTFMLCFCVPPLIVLACASGR
jgi:hypothetical protein